MDDFKSAQLGDRVKDPVSGFKGIATCITTWLHGCVRIGVQPEEITKEGKVAESVYFDQSQLIVVKKAVHTPVILAVTPAPPAPAVRRQGGPSRETAGFKK